MVRQLTVTEHYKGSSPFLGANYYSAVEESGVLATLIRSRSSVRIRPALPLRAVSEIGITPVLHAGVQGSIP